MKEYMVSIDLTMSCNVYVKAENEDEARASAKNYVEDAPYHCVRNGAYVNCEVTDVEVEESL